MLSINKFLCATTQYSSRCVCTKTSHRYTLRLRKTQIADQRYAHTVPQQYIVDEEDAKKYQLPPEIIDLKKYLVYSEYVESKKLKLGYRQNKIKINQLKAKAKAKKAREDAAPVYSTMLKYLRDGEEKTLESEAQEECEAVEEQCDAIEPTTKPIHMPYAATDPYQNVQVSSESEPEFNLPELNEKYKLMYEKYLEAKTSNEPAEDLTTTLLDHEEHRETFTSKFSRKRPLESTKNVPPDWMTDYEQFDDSFEGNESWKSNYGTPNPEIPVSSIPCGGCGALLHCKDPGIPGYLPSELFLNQHNKVLRSSVCQRCHFIKNYQTTLEVKVSSEEYPALLSHIRTKKVAVILMVDLTDFPCSIWPGIMNIIGKTTNVYVVGNKVDLLPNDGPNFLKNVEKSLVQSLNEMGITKANIKSVNLISAKTGYGVEQLINKLHKHWEYKGDVYVIGCTNSGKSSLFNALLGSDYCKIQAADLIQRATVSPWPGTTLNLLKFPILSPVRWRLYLRVMRMKAEREERMEVQQYRAEKFKESKNLKFATLQGHIGKTFEGCQRTEGPGFFGNDAGLSKSGYLGYNENDDIYKNNRWCFDTPGVIHPDQVLHFLTTEELMLTLPQQIIYPRTFDLGYGHTLFVAGLGRLDFVKGSCFIRCTVFASHDLPVTICRTRDAGELYQKLLRTEAFKVPINDPERLKLFPALESKEFKVSGIGTQTSAADVVLSSAGWVALTVEERKEAIVVAWTPEGKGIYLRTPAMLSRSVNLRGPKVPYTPAYLRGKQVYYK